MSLDFYTGGPFWKAPSEYKPGDPLTRQRISEVEQLLDVTLPQTYIRYMLEQNGGELAYRYVLFDDGEAAIIPFLYELEPTSGVGLSPLLLEESGLPSGLVLLTGDFDSWLALDYRKRRSDPGVVYVTSGDDPASGQWQEHCLADTFEEFTRKLFRKQVEKGGTSR